VFTPRNLIIAGVVLIALALGSSGHGVWWLFGLFWVLPHAAGRSHGRGRGRGCGGRSRHHQDRALPHDDAVPRPPAAAQPDPTQDRHEAFPAR
jgi:hypothetical protein